MAFGSSQNTGFAGLNYGGGGNRAQVQGGYVQVPESEGGGGSNWLSGALGLGATIAMFVPGAQWLSPILGAASTLTSKGLGGFAGGGGGGQQKTQAINQQSTTSPGGTNDAPKIDEQTGNDLNPPDKYGPDTSTDKVEPYADPNYDQSQYQAYLHSMFQQNPYLLMSSMAGGGLPGQGFSRYAGGELA